ncbi:MAG: autotransporter-associated beta strand repeat-containing protein, partial [Akkermansia sp.]|nr:autotransporter-associated beta strand repeat-containing protein [Akkermansia sp.]
IGATEQAAGTVQLTATGGITAGNFIGNALTATAAGSITMNDVKVSQTGAQIVSTGEGVGENEYANVVLNSFHGAGAQIKASHGSITVEKSVSGAGSEFKNELHARVGVHFKGTADDNNLSNTNIFTPVLNWDNAARLTSVQVWYWDGPGGSPSALVNVTVGGSLYMENSTMVGDVQITTPTEEEQKVTLNLSDISGQVSGATQLVLNSGGVGNVVVNGSGNLTVTSSGNSDFHCVPRQEGLESLVPPVTVTQEIPTLILNGGSLTVSPATSGDSARLLVTKLTVKETTTLNSGLRLADSNDVLTFNVTEKNAVAWGGYAPGEAPNKTLLTVNGPFTQAGGSFGITASIFLGDQLGNPKENLEKGMWYALMTLGDGKNPDWWDDIYIESTTDGIVPTTDGGRVNREELVWKDGTLYYMSGAELKAATWAPTEESHLWNTTDRNWVQNDMRYRYMDGVTTVFDDTAFNLLADYEGDVYLKGVYTPSSVQVNNSAGNDYTFMDDGAIAGTTTTLTKEGEGSLTIQNANSYSGGTILKQGTLVVANAGALGSGDVTQVGGTLKLSFDGQTSDFGTVTLQGGTVQIAGGAKDFNLVVTGTGARMEGDADNAFTGSLTLEAESHLVSAGSLASWDGPSSITMFNGSMLEMDTNHNIWINDITNLSVVGTATVKNAYLRINPYTNGGKYVLGNGVENLRGEGATAYCLDGSTFDLYDKTTNLNIIVWNEQDIKDNVVEYGTVDTNVDIHAASRLWLYDATIGENATFKMGNTAFLSMGGRSSKTARLNVFTFTGDYATIDDGTLFVEKTEDGSPLVLGTNLSGPDTNVSLRQGTSLDLTGRYLAVNKLSLDTTATSATIGNGMVNSAIVVEAGKTLHLGDPLEISGAVTGGGTLVKDTGGIVNITGSMVNFSGNLVVQGGFFNLLNATSLNNMADVTINKGTLGVYKEETPAEKPATANEGTLTITGGHKLTAGRGTTLNANLVLGGGNKARATLDVHAMAGKGGLQMGSTVTLTPGLVLLSEEDMDGVNALRYMGKYDLFYSVDGLSLDGTPNYLAELGLADPWVKAADVFANDMFKHAEDQYYVFYSGATQAGGAAGNVGTVYIMQVPEPATSTLSLLALAALAARRRK